MALDAETISAHAVTAITSGGGVGVLARLFFKNWLKRQEKFEKRQEDMLELLTRIDERVKVLTESSDKLTEARIKLAILEERSNKHGADLNGLGNKIREITS